MKEVRANCYVEVLCTCPNCGYGLDVLDEVREVMDDDQLLKFQKYNIILCLNPDNCPIKPRK